MKSWTRAIALTTALALASTTVGCGWILYPERRGHHLNGGVIDGGTLVMDLLWLIPGIVPGVVFLIVDFTDGTMYIEGGRHIAVRSTPDGNVALKLKDQTAPMQLDLRVVTASNKILAEQLTDVGPGIHGQTVELHAGTALHAANEPVFVEIRSAAHPDRPLQLPVAL
jgi:hypothetical protein